MRLAQMLEKEDAVLGNKGTIDGLEITGLTADSRAVAPGFLFAALPGAKADGRAFIPSAVAQGAVAILSVPGAEAPAGVPLIVSDNPRRRLAEMAAAFHGAQPATIAAVTGTNGKTSVVTFTRQIWAALGLRAASLGTLGVTGPDGHVSGSLTTPDPVALHASLAGLAADGVSHLAMEASSHGLDQYRLHGVRVRAAAFTNLSQDHLDYHGHMAAYLAAKQKLFSEILVEDGVAVLNGDDAASDSLIAACRARGLRVMTFGTVGADIRLDRRRTSDAGQHVSLTIDGARHEVFLPLAGDFQAMNVLAAMGLVLAGGAPVADVLAALPMLSGVPGRMEHIATTSYSAAVYVDYAHTPDALQTALNALRPHARGRLLVVFGAGGDRDRGKRPLMGAVAAKAADRVFVTDDNPRSEDPARIRAEILAACPGAEEIGDRGAAITRALAGLSEGDLLLVAGKGHETGQIVGDTVLPFDDRDYIRTVLAAGKGAR
ncbi:MAG: UDP-N-acetylmuramoyl-L-alanyl-D-glutamate--2,6-diaminopimelate ligase [Magnetospiraceae bacterium]